MEKWIKNLIILASVLIILAIVGGICYISYIAGPDITTYIADKNYNCDETNVLKEVKKVDSLNNVIISDKNMVDSLNNIIMVKDNKINAFKDMMKINENKYRLLEKSTLK